MCGFQGTQKPYTISGDNGERDPPVPIPNTEVKPFSADGTWLETTWESRTLPDSMKKRTHPLRGGFFFSFHLQRFYSLVVFNQCATLYLEPKSSAPCGRFSEMKAGIAKERIARLLRFPGWESRRKGAEETISAIEPTRNPAHIRRVRIAHPYGLRKKPPVLNSGRLFAYSSDFET